jgi:bifunctional non-homologous end joining protein LigD
MIVGVDVAERTRSGQHGSMQPMLATPVDPQAGLPVDGTVWAFEVKWDGMRVLADLRDGAVRLLSRTGRDVTMAFPELQSLAGVHPDVLLDGEVIVISDGTPSFAELAERFHVRDAGRAAALAKHSPVTLVAFDALRLYGVDLTPRAWQERRESLERLGPSGDAWQLSPAYDDCAALLNATTEQGLEGVVAKRRASRYQPGVRSVDWLKFAHRSTQSCLVVGWRPENGTLHRLGALLLGVRDGAGEPVRFAGRVGSGIGGAAQADLHSVLAELVLDEPAVTGAVPKSDAANAVWVRPQVVVEVRHTGWTGTGRLRQPVFRGIRSDVDPESVTAEPGRA